MLQKQERKPRGKLSDAKIAALTPPAKGYRLHYDRDGLALRLTEAGGRRFTLDYYTASGQRRRMTVGEWSPAFGIAHARAKAAALKVQIADGGDPLGDVATARIAHGQRETVTQLAAEFMRQRVIPKNRERTQIEYQSILDRYILPALGTLAVADVKPGQLLDLINGIKAKHKVTSNRVRAVVSVMLNHAVMLGWIATSPFNPKFIEAASEPSRVRYLSPDEFARLDAALATLHNQQAANAIRLLFWTGARRGETLRADWSEFDLEQGIWTKPSHHTKQKKEHRIALHPEAVALLRRIRAGQAAEQLHVFPSDEGGSIQGLKRSWTSLMKRAEIKNFRVHDLRHNFASRLAIAGATGKQIGDLLGHTQPGTTDRYMHLGDESQRKTLALLATPALPPPKDAVAAA